MTTYSTQKVLSIHHWNEHLFSIKITRPAEFKFLSGQFVMLGLEHENHKIVRAYSIVSSIYDEFLEFLSIKIKDGALTSKLHMLNVGDNVILSKKPTGTLVLRDLSQGKRLYMLATGTGIAPFLSIIQDLDLYDMFEKVVLVHSARKEDDLAYRTFLTKDIIENEYYSEQLRDKFIYYPTLTQAHFINNGRITDIINNHSLFEKLEFPNLNPKTDRVMVCGNPFMLKETRQILDDLEFKMSPYIGMAGDYVIEHAFVSK